MSALGPYRLPSAQRAAAVPFSFDGRTLHGVEGDTVASALLANGVRIVARSFKFHRPRGIFSAGYEEPNALVQLHSGARAVPSARATLTRLQPGLEVYSQSGWPSVSNDLVRAIDVGHSLFAAGFYNKTFIWPSWKFYDPIIRKLAGLGRAPDAPDPDRYVTQHAHCDVLVVGGGSAGIESAATAAAAGKDVMLAEMNHVIAGDVSGLKALSKVRLCPRTTAVGHYDHNLVVLVEALQLGSHPNQARERLWLVRAGKVILATGAIEQPLIFCNNDRPGIMLAGAALKYLRDHSVAPGRRVVIATNNDSAYPVARELRTAGVNIVKLVDSRAPASPALADEMRILGIPVARQAIPVDSSGFGALRQVTFGALEAPNGGPMRTEKIACDALLVSGGWSPALHLLAQAGGRLAFCARSGAFQALELFPTVEVAGSARQISDEELGVRISPVGNTARQWIDLRHDVTVSDIELAVRENYTAVEHIKRYTTLGMSVDQGKVGQAPAIEIIAATRGVSPSGLGHTTFRPPFVPVTLGTLVGRNVGEFFAPTRRSPLHPVQQQSGALFDDFGEWRRAAAFPHAGESRKQAMHREVYLVRNGLGLFDASPLGKIEIAGPDALEFVNRFYLNNLLNLKPGRARYGIMLRETGVVFDDGTIVVLDDDRVVLTTTSSGAGRVYQWLEEWRQCEWPDSRVVVVPVTEQWATVAISGQRAREVLEQLHPECDLSNEAFPHLGVRVTRLLGSEARIYRVSFTGELTYEINVPSDQGVHLWAALREYGRTFGIAPYGVDALLHLRMEKGFLHIGADTDGTTVPDDIGWGKAAAAKSGHYVGKRSLTLPENVRPDRLQLIGLTGDVAAELPIGSHLRLTGSSEPTDGWITSGGRLSTDGTPVAMAMLRAGRSQLQQRVSVHDAGRIVSHARVVNPLFYDPTGARMHA
jgi:sarcosine oxidase, subunit alpha